MFLSFRPVKRPNDFFKRLVSSFRCCARSQHRGSRMRFEPPARATVNRRATDPLSPIVYQDAILDRARASLERSVLAKLGCFLLARARARESAHANFCASRFLRKQISTFIGESRGLPGIEASARVSERARLRLGSLATICFTRRWRSFNFRFLLFSCRDRPIVLDHPLVGYAIRRSVRFYRVRLKVTTFGNVTHEVGEPVGRG